MNMSQELTTYRQTEIETASPVELVIMLYDALVNDLTHTIEAIRGHSIEDRVRHSNHAFSVLQELDLMLDFKNGGDTAKELARVYSYVRAKLMECQFKLDPAILERQIEFVAQIRQCWQQSLTAAKQTEDPKPASEMPSFLEVPGSPYGNVGEGAQSCSWSA